MLGLARKLVRERGYGAVALDAPGHGDRLTKAMAEAAPRAVAEWKALLDDLGSDPRWAGAPVGYWGVSMGTAFGVPLIATEPRIGAAVLGLGALREGHEAQRAHAAAITIPLLFLLQWDDEIVTREAGVALWDAFGSQTKTMHINPGPHGGIPPFERDAGVAFYQRHLEG